MSQNCSWIIAHQDTKALKCCACNTVETMPFSSDIKPEYWTAISRVFIKNHQHCIKELIKAKLGKPFEQVEP